MSVPSSSAGPDVARALMRRFEAAGATPRLVETHISAVILVGDEAWKLKKPVDFGFLDFSGIDARERACREELRLNARLAPSLYLGVVPIHATAGGVAPGRDGDGPAPSDAAAPGAGGPGPHDPIVDWAVRMRRLPEGAIAADRLAAGRLDAADLERFAHRLAAFHRDAPVAPLDSPWGRGDAILASALATVDALAARVDPAACAMLRAWFVGQAGGLQPAWAARRIAGRVREGHGDLHLENVIVTDDDTGAFDCIEFDPALRWIDTMNDVAFVIADLLARGRDDLAWGFLDATLEAGGDFEGLAVLRFYAVHRATIRALVCALREAGGLAAGAGPGGAAWLAAARRLAACADPRLMVTCGLPGSGKSRVTRRLLERTGAVRVRSDVERKRMAGLGARDDSRAAGDLYGPASSDAVYVRLAQIADTALRAGWPTIVDAACLRRAERDRLRAVAVARRVPYALLSCAAPMPVLRERVRARAARGGDPSEADEAVLERLATRFEPPADDERDASIDAAGEPDRRAVPDTDGAPGPAPADAGAVEAEAIDRIAARWRSRTVPSG